MRRWVEEDVVDNGELLTEDVFFQVHVNLMILEARNQAELLYALRGIMRYMT